jgi:hypothetical protein
MQEQRIYIYYPPPTGEVRRIWDACELGASAEGNTVKQSLLLWVYNNTYNKNAKIAWRDPSDVGYEMTWSTMLRWFEMACRHELLVIKDDGNIEPNERASLPRDTNGGYYEENRTDDGKGECTIL